IIYTKKVSHFYSGQLFLFFMKKSFFGLKWNLFSFSARKRRFLLRVKKHFLSFCALKILFSTFYKSVSSSYAYIVPL
ncbi:TPA: hypothetical protein ACSKNV_002829, partial [Listeria innocua]